MYLYHDKACWDVTRQGIPNLVQRSYFAHDWRYERKLVHWVRILRQRFPAKPEMTIITLAQGITTMQLADEQMESPLQNSWIGQPLVRFRANANWSSWDGSRLRRKARRTCTANVLQLRSRWGGFHSMERRRTHGKPVDPKYYEIHLVEPGMRLP